MNSLIDFVKSKKGNVDVIYIDYLDLLQSATFIKPNNDADDLKQIQEICRTLAALARDLNIPIILLSQVGSSSDFEKAVERLNAFSEKVENKNTIKMFIGKQNIIDTRIDCSDIVHVILIDGYELKHFSSINIKEIYGDR